MLELDLSVFGKCLYRWIGAKEAGAKPAIDAQIAIGDKVIAGQSCGLGVAALAMSNSAAAAGN